MSLETYQKALKAGRKSMKREKDLGHSPYLPALENILSREDIKREEPLGLIQIPINQIAGTRFCDRANAFSADFLPILDESSEFATKWDNLYTSQLEKGITDPIIAYEYYNTFYVVEGNKRVSVLKFLEGTSIPGTVTRLVPKWNNTLKTRIYYEFMEFYRLSGLNIIYFSKAGSFIKLQRLTGKSPGETWRDDDRLTFQALYSRFTSLLDSEGLPPGTLPGDIFLAFIEVVRYSTLKTLSTAEIATIYTRSKDGLLKSASGMPVDLILDPIEKKKSLLSLLLPGRTSPLKAAFLYMKTPETSAWTYGHELGRKHLENTLGDLVSTTTYADVTDANIDACIDDAADLGCEIIFTTAPPLLWGSIRGAIKHKSIKFLNCSLNVEQQSIRTYYARIHEAKFLMGAIAASLSETDRLGYIADYPIYGTNASINAFALGARLVNPRSQVHLLWTTLKDATPPVETFREMGITCIAGPDFSKPGSLSRRFGLFQLTKSGTQGLAAPLWHWGKFYEQTVSAILKGTWKTDETLVKSKAMNYWWGLKSDMVELIPSGNLPVGTIRLIHLLEDAITKNDYNPFSGVLYAQNGIVEKDPEAFLSPEEIATMDWLSESVVGRIPALDALTDEARAVVMAQGGDETARAMRL